MLCSRVEQPPAGDTNHEGDAVAAVKSSGVVYDDRDPLVIEVRR